MNKYSIPILLVTLFSPLLSLADGHATEFRHFIREFFKSEEYQLESIKFPVKHTFYKGDEITGKIVTELLSKKEWNYLKGPSYLRCEKNCYDIIIYDNFNKKHRDTKKRVLSLEGVNNGINASLYFELIGYEWYLVEYEDFSN